MWSASYEHTRASNNSQKSPLKYEAGVWKIEMAANTGRAGGAGVGEILDTRSPDFTLTPHQRNQGRMAVRRRQPKAENPIAAEDRKSNGRWATTAAT